MVFCSAETIRPKNGLPRDRLCQSQHRLWSLPLHPQFPTVQPLLLRRGIVVLFNLFVCPLLITLAPRSFMAFSIVLPGIGQTLSSGLHQGNKPP